MHIAEKRKGTKLAILTMAVFSLMSNQDPLDEYQCNTCFKGHMTCKCGEEQDDV